MTEPTTLVAVLRYWAAADPDRIAYRLLDERGAETEALSYGDLYLRSMAVARQLSRHCSIGERVLLVLPTSIEFLYGFFGCLLARLVVVPLPVPRPRSVSMLSSVIADCAPVRILAAASLRALVASEPELAGLASDTVVTVDELLAADAADAGPTYDSIASMADDIALLQYTSGSTSRPKGVMVSHANIVANQRMICEAFDHRGPVTVVAWAPLYHDQGLIGNVLQPLFIGGCAVLMPPAAFFRDPILWLELIHRYRAHTSGGPNFAFELCVTRYNEARVAPLDLSCWKVAFNGAEPVSAQVLRAFSMRYAAHGFSATAHFPCYGLAEATLYVSGGPAHHEPDVLAYPDGSGEVVSVGTVHREIDVVVIDELGQKCSEGCVGEICLRGPNVTSGYWNLPAGGAPHFVTLDVGGPSFLATGDLGFVRDGQLFVTGRKKELIILRGRNIYPYDIERSIAVSHEGFRPGHCAVFGHVDGSEQRIYAVQEIERTYRGKIDFHEVAGLVRRKVSQHHGVMLYRIYFVRPGYLPKTTSGKTKRLLLPSLLIETPIDSDRIYASC